MCVAVSKTAISLALQRARKHASVGLFGCICRVRTEVHMSPCHVLFIYCCMRHGKKFLGSDRVATSLRTYGVKNVKHPWSKMVSPMTQRRFHVTCSHMLLCVPTRKSVRLTIKIACLVSSHTQQCDCRLTDTETYIGLGRMCNISVSALGPDSMLSQHIFDVNSHLLVIDRSAKFHTLSKCWIFEQIETLFRNHLHHTKFQHNLKFKQHFCWIYVVFHFAKNRIETPLVSVTLWKHSAILFFVHISKRVSKRISAAVMRKTVLAVALLTNGVPSTSRNLVVSRLCQHQPQIERGWSRYTFLDHAYSAAPQLKALASVCWLRVAVVCCAELLLVVA